MFSFDHHAILLYLLTLIPLVGMPLVSSLEITLVTVLTIAATTFFYLTVTWIESDIPYIYITCVFLNLTMAAFWAWWGIAFKHHPQLFVTPVGFSLIFITYLNRSDLSLEMMRRFRSFAGVIIYMLPRLLNSLLLLVFCRQLSSL